MTHGTFNYTLYVAKFLRPIICANGVRVHLEIFNHEHVCSCIYLYCN